MSPANAKPKANDNMKNLKGSFITIPTHVLSEKEISSSDKLLLGLLISYSRQRGYAYALNQHLAKILGCGISRVSTGISRLAKARYVTIESPGSFRRKIKIEKWVFDDIENDNPYQELKRLYEQSDYD